MEMINPTETTAWQALQRHYEVMRSVSLSELFAADGQRFKKFSACFSERLLLDYSKNLITTETLEKLLALAEETHLQRSIQSLVNGEKINHTEDRAVLHMALRNRANTPTMVDGKDVMPQINAVLARMRQFCTQVQSGSWRGYSGLAITDVVNIGIGGSHLGPSMVTQALTPYKNSLTLHFISNIDGSEITEVLQALTPATTLFLVASKTFTTQETLINAATARRWFLAAAPHSSHMRQHFIALSANVEAVAAFGIEPVNHFEYWDWVGGRFSLWSAAGLSIALAIGFEHFEQLLAGAHAMDLHFIETPFKDNLPVILALLSIWYGNFFGAETEAILPYDHHLQRLRAYLQQANMESNGKSVDRTGNVIHYQTGPILWGEPGTNGQHAFYQLLHQGTHLIPCDFIATIEPHHSLAEHHTHLLANVFAQTQALAFGKTPEEVMLEQKHMLASSTTPNSDTLPFRVLKGNCPSNTLLLRKMTPYNLGLLIALYEHKIFSQGAMLNIFSFDQWGVEWGKQLAQHLKPVLLGADSFRYDSSTNGLIDCFKAWRNQIGT